MTNNEITKTSGEVSSEKIKAIYPHIVVSGDIDKPYYSIQYYNIEKKTMFDCYASYKLGLVRKWLEEHFEVIEPDIADLINRQQVEIESQIKAVKYYQKKAIEIKDEAIKEFAEKANKMITDIYNKHIFGCNDLNDEEKDAIINFSDDITGGFDNLLKEMESNAE